ADMFTGARTENRGDSGLLDAAALRQQRRLKQAIQFLHKDSADLLPLDGLKKLGTSKQGQPHHILQKRLLEAKLSRGRMNMCGVTPNNAGLRLSCTHLHSHEDEEDEEEGFIYVPSKCLGQDVNLLIDTGCKLNLMSSLTVERFGLKDLVEENKMETDGFPFQRKLCIDGHTKELSLTIGQLRVMCSFAIIESNRPLMSLGNKTLKALKCVIDTEKQMLVFGTAVREQVQFVKKPINKSTGMTSRQTTASEAALVQMFLGKQGSNITFVVDSSDNMRAALGSVKRLLIQTLLTKASFRDSLFNIMTFSGKLTCWSPHMLPCAPDTVYMALSWIHSISCSPGRDLLAALSMALTDPACHAIHLLCAGPPEQPEAVLRALPALSAGRPLNVFYLQDSGGQLDCNAQNFMQCLTRATGGSCYVIPVGLNGVLEKVVPLHIVENQSSAPTVSPVKCSCPSTSVLIPHDTSLPLLRCSLSNPLRPVTSCMMSDRTPSPDFYPGCRVLARKEVDGLYYLGTVIQQVQDRSGVWVVEFDHPGGADLVVVSSQRQLVCSLDMVNHARARTSCLLPGDAVLSPWEPGLRRYGPGRVMAATERRDGFGVEGVASLRVLMWNGRVILVPGSLVFPISSSHHDRIVRELQISTSACGRCCSWLCARSSSCTPQLVCSHCCQSSSRCCSASNHQPCSFPPSCISSCGGMDGFERAEQDKQVDLRERDTDVRKSDHELPSTSSSSSSSLSLSVDETRAKLRSKQQRPPWRNHGGTLRGVCVSSSVLEEVWDAPVLDQSTLRLEARSSTSRPRLAERRRDDSSQAWFAMNTSSYSQTPDQQLSSTESFFNQRLGAFIKMMHFKRQQAKSSTSLRRMRKEKVAFFFLRSFDSISGFSSEGTLTSQHSNGSRHVLLAFRHDGVRSTRPVNKSMLCSTGFCEMEKESNQSCNGTTRAASPLTDKRQTQHGKYIADLLKRIRIHPEAQRILGNSCIPVVRLERLNLQSVSLSCLQPVVSLVRLPCQTQARLHNDVSCLDHPQQNGVSENEENILEIREASARSKPAESFDLSHPDTTPTSWTEPYCPDSSPPGEPEQDSGFDCESNPDQPYILFDSGSDEWDPDAKTNSETFYLDPDAEETMVIKLDPEPEVDQAQSLQLEDESETRCEVDVVQMDDSEDKRPDLCCSQEEADQDRTLELEDEPETKCEVDLVQMEDQRPELSCLKREADSPFEQSGPGPLLGPGPGPGPGPGTEEMESEDFCAVCLNGGDLLCCDRCPKVYHLVCHVPPLSSFPLGDWVCTLCRTDQEPTETYDCENMHSCGGVKAPYTLSNQDQRRCEKLTLLLYCHTLSAPFHEPVSPLARNYYQIVKRPIDLSVIRRKLDKANTLHYFTAEQFVDDVLLMFKNCASFNLREFPDSEVGQAGRNLEVFFLSKLREIFPDRTFPLASQERTDRARLRWLSRKRKENYRKKRCLFSGKKYFL
ncbi:hypothetical protein L3Q82_023670, partial [Scortum barcoo]